MMVQRRGLPERERFTVVEVCSEAEERLRVFRAEYCGG